MNKDEYPNKLTVVFRTYKRKKIEIIFGHIPQ